MANSDLETTEASRCPACDERIDVTIASRLTSSGSAAVDGEVQVALTRKITGVFIYHACGDLDG